MKRIILGLAVSALVFTACEMGTTSPDAGSGGGGGAATGGGGGGGGGTATGGGGGSTTDAGTPGTIVDVAAGNPDFSILVAAVTKAGLAQTLADANAQYTVFAPTNAAFAQLLATLGITNGLDGLTAEQLAPILKYHVLATKVESGAATTAAMANTKVDSLGGKVQLSLQGSTIRLDGTASVTAADVQASNGVIHVIDRVILPSIADVATTTPTLSSLVAAAALADTATPSPGLVAALDDDAAAKITVFAPTNTAFTALVTALRGSDDGASTGITALTSFRADQVLPVLRYHLLGSQVLSPAVPASGTVDALGGKLAVTRNGSTVTVDGATVVTANILTSNGVVHVIDQVLVPSITDVVTTDDRFTGLKAAVLAADGDAATTPKVAAALDGTANFTLFAPTNAAFTALGAGAPSGQALTNVLLFHAVPGAPVYAATALALTSPLTAATAYSGRSVEVNAEGTPRGVTVKDSTSTKGAVTQTNLFTSNGVIHVVDKVLIPAP
jgi:transforming growth factor-beta-induced protein